MFKPGFTLLELVMYMVLLSIFSLVITGFLPIVYACLRVSSHASALKIRESLACDLVRKDVMSALPGPGHWDLQACVFKKEVLDASGKITMVHVGFQPDLKRKGLLRHEGMYDFIAKRWLKRTVSFFGCPITSLAAEFSPDHKKIIIFYNNTHHDVIKLRNRVLL